MQLMELLTGLRRAASTRRGRNVVLFTIFLALSSLFWLMTVLDDEVQRYYNLPLTITDVPADVTFLTDPNRQLHVVVRDRGSALLRREWFSKQQLQLSFNDFDVVKSQNRLVINSQQLANRVRSLFSITAEVVAVRPDSLSLGFTTRPGELLPVFAKVDARPAARYIISGPIEIDPDTVKVYTTGGLPSKVVSLNTTPLSLRNLTDTARVEVNVAVPQGARAIPETVTVTVPVEPLVTKQRTVTIDLLNVPSSVKLITFPTTIDVSYLVPMSRYGNNDDLPTVWVDYNEARRGRTTIPLHVARNADYSSGITTSHSEVEYIIEYKSHGEDTDATVAPTSEQLNADSSDE